MKGVWNRSPPTNQPARGPRKSLSFQCFWIWKVFLKTRGRSPTNPVLWVKSPPPLDRLHLGELRWKEFRKFTANPVSLLFDFVLIESDCLRNSAAVNKSVSQLKLSHQTPCPIFNSFHVPLQNNRHPLKIPSICDCELFKNSLSIVIVFLSHTSQTFFPPNLPDRPSLFRVCVWSATAFKSHVPVTLNISLNPP